MKNIIISDPASLPALTLDSMLASDPDDYSLLETIVDQQAGGYCTALEFAGSSKDRQTGQSELEWLVTVPVFTGGWDRDEDGGYRDSTDSTESISVVVTPNMTLGEIAQAVTTAVRDIENSVFA